MYIKVDDEVWENCIQDAGCSEKDLPEKRYKKAKILSLGPKDGEQLFYYHLTKLAIDYTKEMV